MKCPACNKNKAVIHPIYGVTFCEKCQKKERSAGTSTEFTTESIRDSRLEYARDIIQPFYDGVLSKEYIEEYNTTGIEVTEEQIKKAEYVYKDQKGWWNRHKSKGGRNFKKIYK